MRFLLAFLIFVVAPGVAYDGPVIDMHFHALPNGAEAPVDDPRNIRYMKWALNELEEFNVVLAATSGPPEFLKYWSDRAPGRLLRSPVFPCVDGLTPTYNRQPCFSDGGDFPDLGWLENAYLEGQFEIMGELMNQYAGIPFDDPRMLPYYQLAERLEVPVAFHTHAGPPNISDACCPNFRLALGNPILLEEVLVRYPRLKVQIMHASPLIYPVVLDILRQYPGVFVDISPFHLLLTREDFHRLIKTYKDNRLLDRVMFGSDMTGLERAIKAYEGTDFLSPQDLDDIFCNNAARFLGRESVCHEEQGRE